MGRPRLDSGVVVQDTKTGKTLTYVGFDFAPKEETVTVGGKKTKPSYLYAPAGGMKVLYFKDEAGKSVIYTPRDIEKTTFIEPPAGQQAPEEAPVIAEETGEETAGGLPTILETATGADMSGREGADPKWKKYLDYMVDEDEEWQDYKAQVSSVQDSIDLYLQEDRLRQELEENE